MRKTHALFGYFTFVMTTILTFDQISKTLIVSSADLPKIIIENFFDISPFMRIILHYNSGIAFSIPLPQAIIIPLILLIIVIGLHALSREIHLDHPLTLTTLALIFGGTLGNLIDRIRLGHVIDFISIWKFPVFNIADIAITCGIAMLIFGIYKTPALRRGP